MDETITWRTQERRIRARTPDWYWILGIFAATLAITSLIFGNILFAVVIVTGAIAIGFASVGAKKEYTIALTPKGIVIDETLYPYENVLSFCILEYPGEEFVLSVRTKSIMAPQLSIPITHADPYDVYDVLAYYIEEDDHQDSVFDQLVDFLGF